MHQEPETPPADADEWSDQQWIDWLKKTDADASTDVQETPTTTLGQIAHSTGGQLVGNAMMGLAQALYGQQPQKPAIVAETGEPGTDEPLEVHVDVDHPDQSYVIVRPHSESSE